MGPASAVAAAVSDTATSISIRRDRSTLTPSAAGAVIAISTATLRRTSSAAPVSNTIISGAEGGFICQTVERPGVPPSPAVSAVSSGCLL